MKPLGFAAKIGAVALVIAACAACGGEGGTTTTATDATPTAAQNSEADAATDCKSLAPVMQIVFTSEVFVEGGGLVTSRSGRAREDIALDFDAAPSQIAADWDALRSAVQTFNSEARPESDAHSSMDNPDTDQSDDDARVAALKTVVDGPGARLRAYLDSTCPRWDQPSG